MKKKKRNWKNQKQPLLVVFLVDWFFYQEYRLKEYLQTSPWPKPALSFLPKLKLMFYPALDKLIPKTKNQIFFVDNSIFLYTLNREDKKTFFPLLEKMFSCPPYSKCIKKVWNFHLHQQKIFWLLVSFSLRFQYESGWP